MCGKCGGDNSTCVSIKGSYNNSTYGYTRVVRIPAGSSNLDIRQYGHKGITDDNYLGETVTMHWRVLVYFILSMVLCVGNRRDFIAHNLVLDLTAVTPKLRIM